MLAVDDLSFEVERGQVCGLLGPNGAGKTTCLRMLLGLITPTQGETYLFGEKVAPGQPSRCGASARSIETAAFVPHLSGMKNLELWWKAGGAHFADADLDQALAIADLGDAVNRKVKTYSQGMKQRLGLARVLLGRPEVLVLDEPTNGLDPGEMREVRLLVHRLADAGATVLFSSHVLAEVEQICTHAVVMDRGHLVAEGSVAALIGSSGSVYLEVDDVDRCPPRARAAADGHPGRRRAARARRSPSTAARGRSSSPRSCTRRSASRRSPPGGDSRRRSSAWWRRIADGHRHRRADDPADRRSPEHRVSGARRVLQGGSTPPHVHRVRLRHRDPDHHHVRPEGEPARSSATARAWRSSARSRGC